MISWLGPIVGILLIDLVLSGDNAVVIGVTASTLPHQQRKVALIVGGGGAVVARIVFALAATNLLQLNFLGIIGSIILLFIAIRLLVEHSTQRRSDHNKSSSIVKPLSNQQKPQTEPPHTQTDLPVQKKSTSKNLLVSIATILLADVTMSLDNVLAIGGLAQGNAQTLIVGLLFSVIFLMVGSALVAEFVSRLPWLLDLACLIIAWTAADILIGDDSLIPFLNSFRWIPSATHAIAVILVLIIAIFLRIRDHQHLLRS